MGLFVIEWKWMGVGGRKWEEVRSGWKWEVAVRADRIPRGWW